MKNAPTEAVGCTIDPGQMAKRKSWMKWKKALSNGAKAIAAMAISISKL